MWDECADGPVVVALMGLFLALVALDADSSSISALLTASLLLEVLDVDKYADGPVVVALMGLFLALVALDAVSSAQENCWQPTSLLADAEGRTAPAMSVAMLLSELMPVMEIKASPAPLLAARAGLLLARR